MQNERRFRDILTSRQREVDSLLCVGFDPLVEKIPPHIRRCCTSDWSAVLIWMQETADATADVASMFKPQSAYWEAIDGGTKALNAFADYLVYKHPNVVRFLDCKRGDIDRTQSQYGKAHLDLQGFDGMNYNPYMGEATLKSLIDTNHMGRGLVGLGRTSNKEAWAIQDLVQCDGRRLWEVVVQNILDWSTKFGVLADAGVVMGAAHRDPNDPAVISSQHLARARAIVHSYLWLLIPGIGNQGGFIEETIRAAFAGPGSIAVNSSSGIIFASQGQDFAEAARSEAIRLRDAMRAAGGSCLVH